MAFCPSLVIWLATLPCYLAVLHWIAKLQSMVWLCCFYYAPTMLFFVNFCSFPFEYGRERHHAHTCSSGANGSYGWKCDTGWAGAGAGVCLSETTTVLILFFVHIISSCGKSASVMRQSISEKEAKSVNEVLCHLVWSAKI